MSKLTQNQKRNLINKSHIRAELDLERTILAKQRTLLAETNVFLGVVGLGLLFFKFFDNIIIRITGMIISTISIYMITKIVHRYNKFKRKIKSIDRRNHHFS